ncbi:hypothetical protein HN51_019153 [Arachis hypogaea]|uniref:Protein NRT1/ PTR FAMILY 2.6 n=2 Tax=Arachis TaxID=3817 RepID=A0A445BVT0_ARAHY|nr:protein NRT1/ PTR FAMILY 2.6-like [Arachis duranensis]XP_025613998.1 protein NRT1/ PTR FAMILY 2.6 [Arachis hypogaea]QHO30868.1 Protein NRT1/ PTR FAMILY 2 [Arachis hypogaea]RYR42830.1 hypothetical protein Ahy_A08g039269 [Arachis hypogaea]
MESTHSSLREEEARKNNTSGSKPGGWPSFPFIIATVAGITLASSGIWANLIVYLIQEFNIKSISATQISNVVNGTTNLVPFVAAIIADCFFGSFTLVLVSSCVSLLGTIVFALTASIKSLRPKQCINNGSNICEAASVMQYGVLYVGIALVAIGFGGTRFTTAALGANQFHDNTHHQTIFFNWFFFTWYVVSVAGFTGLVYIQDNVSWGVGFWICVVSNMIGVMVFLMGYRYYLPQTPRGRSAFVDLARVPVASIRKWKSQLSSSTQDYYNGAHHHDATLPAVSAIPAKRFRFFNRAALLTEGDSIEKSWRLCTVQQVEDFKKVIGILPLLTSSIFLAIPIGMEANLSLLQALVMEAHLGPHFKFPAGSLGVILLISTSIFLSLLDRVLWPFYQKITGKTPTPLQRIGVGHVFNILGMVVSAIVESKRLKMFHDANKSMSILWLFPQLVLVGVGEAFHFPGQVAFYYQQLPQSLSSTSTAMISLIIGIAFYLITALTHEVRRSTHWLPDNIDYGRVDNVYWMLVLFSGINFVYYLICATFYKYTKI